MTAQTASDMIAKRIAEVTTPVNGPDAPEKKKVPLTWEEEELAYYEPKRSVAVEAKRKADARAALLRQLPHQLNALREVIAIRCEGINTKAGRIVLRSANPDRYRFEVWREDDLGFFMQFDAEKKKVIFAESRWDSIGSTN